jgi:uncharacterized protein
VITDRPALPSPPVLVNPESEPFWRAAGQGRLILKRCVACRGVVWYPREICPLCHAQDTEWFTASGQGTVYAFSVVRRSPGDYAEHVPYVLAYVELEEGPRMITNIVDCDPADVFIGQQVVARFDPAGDGTALVRFRPR